MSFDASFLFLLFGLGLVLSNGAHESPAELYWKTKVGNIPMPKVLQDSLGSNDGLANIDPHFQLPSHVQDNDAYIYASSTSDDAELMLYAQGVQDDRVLFFTNEKLLAGSKMKLHFRNIDNGAKFLRSRDEKSMAVASNKLQMILNILSVNPESTVAEYIDRTIKFCDKTKDVKNEVRYCATSLEAMVDKVTSSLNSGKNELMAVSTEQDKDVLMEYTIQKAEKLGKDDKHTMTCHKLDNPYAVFLCHNIKSTDVYGVSLMGVNGQQTKAIAVCHKDTSAWNPNHIALQLLKLKPGSKPICHFLSGDAIVWLGK